MIKYLLKYKAIPLFVILFIFLGCSRDVNTRFIRWHHSLNAYYNVYFNEKEAYRFGIENIEDKYKLNYNDFLPIYIPVNQETKKLSQADFRRAIAKGFKTIRERSIQAKPKLKKPIYKLNEQELKFYNQNEFNKWVDQAHLVIAKSYYQLGMLDSAKFEFDFITVEYPEKYSRYESYLWLARIAVDENNIDDAQNYLSIANNANASDETKEELPLVYAYMNLKTGKLKQALPHLKSAIKFASRSKDKAKLYFLTAQIYERLENSKEAHFYYKKAISKSPEYEMKFFAKLKTYTMEKKETGNIVLLNDRLSDMLQDSKNREYKGVIFDAFGDSEYDEGRIDTAVTFYLKAVANSSSNNQKAESAYKLGNIFFARHEFPKAKLCYEVMKSTIDKSSLKYNLIKEKLSILQQITLLHETIYDEDFKRNPNTIKKLDSEINWGKYVDKVDTTEASNNYDLVNPETKKPSGQWYFDNSDIAKLGIREFKKRWGNRILEDNWRRTYKQSISPEIDEDKVDTIKTDTLKKIVKQIEDTTVQLLNVPESDILISRCLVKLGDIYNSRLEAYENSRDCFLDHLARYPRHPKNHYIYYQLIGIYARLNDSRQAEYYKNKLLAEFPESIYAKAVKDIDYVNLVFNLKKAKQEKYDNTYQKFVKGNFNDVTADSKSIISDSLNNDFVTKSKFLRIMSDYKSSLNKEICKTELQDFIKQCKDSSLIEQSKYIIEHLDFNFDKDLEVRLSQKPSVSNAFGDTASKKNNILLGMNASNVDISKGYTFDTSARHLYVIIVQFNKRQKINELKFELNMFNIEEAENIDLLVNSTYLGNDFELVTVGPLLSAQEAYKYYYRMSLETPEYESIKDSYFQEFVISEENLVKLIKTGKFDEYTQFFEQNYNETVYPQNPVIFEKTID